MQKLIISTIVKLLKNDENLRKIIGDKIFTFNASGHREEQDLQSSLPEITHTPIITNAKNRDCGIFESLYQVSCWANTLAEADEISNEVVRILDRHMDTNGIERINFDTITSVRDATTDCFGVHIRFWIVWRKRRNQ